MLQRQLTTAIADIDDTLIPWEAPHSLAYPAMSLALSLASGIPEDQIIKEIREVNTLHGTIEYTPLVQSMESFKTLPKSEINRLIRIAIDSRRLAMQGLNNPFEGIKPLLETFRTQGLVNLALSDAPVNLAYLRLKKANLSELFNLLIGVASPDDSHFEPEFHMGDKPFSIPTRVADRKKPDTNLEKLLELSAEEIRRSHFMYGNSAHSDMGLAKAYGLLFYKTEWDQSNNGAREILKQYAPESVLKHNIGSAEDKARPAHPDFECVVVKSPQEIIADLRSRGLLKN